MQLSELQRNWNVFGETDPLWSVLTDVRFKNNKWDPVAFFRTGEQEIDAVFAGLDSMGVQVPHGRALDFGCAVGRLTQALCRHFDRCDGVDIAPSMIELARKYDQFPGRCQYHVNDRDDLALFPDNTFDFVYSRLVLQHMQPVFSKKYIREFIRVLAPGGIALFQIPAGSPDPAVRPPNSFDLPAAGFKASLAVEASLPQLQAGAPFCIDVKVTNLSPIAWPESRDGNGRDLVVLGNHWLTGEGRMIIQDDGRTPVMQGLKPGESATIPLWVTAPTAAGIYTLELDMVKEGVAWFKQRGSNTFRVRVEVRGSVSQEPSGKKPVMEMHCVPKQDVLALIESAGGKTLLVMDDHSADPLLSYQYVVTKTNDQRRASLPMDAASGISIESGRSSLAGGATPAADEATALLNGLAQHAALQARVNEGLVKRLLNMEAMVRETRTLMHRLGAEAPAGGRFAVYQGNNIALTRILNRYAMYVDTTDLSMTPQLMMQGQWEPAVTNFLLGVVRPGMTVVDIGAGFGYFSVLAGAHVGPDGTVEAIEADPRNHEILRLNVEANGLSGVVHTHQRAVLNVKRQMELRRNPSLVAQHSLFAGEKSHPENTWVQAGPLDEIVKGNVDLMKIDAPGSEPYIFEGMPGVLQRNPHLQIVLEFSAPILKQAGADAQGFLRKLKELGFKISVINSLGNVEPANEKQLLTGRSTALLLTRL